MNLLKKLVGCKPSKDDLERFDAYDMQIEWLPGNNLKLTFLKDCYIPAGDTITMNVSFKAPDITPGVIYENRVKFNVENG